MIEYLKLTNFKRHEHLEISLENGLTVLSGANEAGKSSILHAILYALYGSRALPRSLEGSVTYGKPVASLKVELGLKVGGVLYTVTRSKSGAEMSGGGVLSSGQAEVTAAVERLLGANMAAASKLLVASQGDLRGIVERGSEAVKLIEELADLDAIEGLVEKIQSVLPTGSTAALVAQAAALGELEQPVLVELSAEITAASRLAEAKTSAAASASQQLAQARDTLAQQEVALHQYAAWHRDIDRLLAVVNAPRLQENVWTVTDIATLEAAAETQRKDAATRAAWQQWQTLAPAEHPGEAPALLHKEVHRLQMELQAARLARINDESCALCGKLLQDVPEVVAGNSRVDSEVARLENELQVVSAQAKAAESALSLWSLQLKKHQTYEMGCAKLGDYVKGGAWVGGSVPAEADRTDYAARIQAERTKRNQMAVHAERLRAEKQQVEAASTELAALQAAGPAKPEDLSGLQMQVKRLVAEVKTLMAEAEVAKQNLAELKSLDAANKARYEAEVVAYAAGVKRRAELLQLISATEKHNALIKKLRLARPVIASKLWAGLLGAISSTFSTLRGVGSVVGRDSDGFVVDGKPVGDLSGSTLDVLGLAVRVNLLRAFLPGVGLLILDEPAAAMDGERESIMLGTLAGLGLDQVLMVSHSDSAKAIANNVVQL